MLDLTKGHTLRPASKEWRAKSADELKMVAVSMHLQQALKVPQIALKTTRTLPPIAASIISCPAPFWTRTSLA